MFKVFKLLAITSVFLFSFSTSAGIIFSENFSGGESSLVGWFDNDGSLGFEIYGSGSTTPYGVSATYDHDNNPATPEIQIPAGLEINDDAGSVTLTTVNFLLSELVSSNDVGILSYFAGVRRNNAAGATVEVFNVTQNFSLTGSLSNIIFNSGQWTYNSFEFLWGSSNFGDEIAISWFGGGNSSANGQQIADVKLAAQTSSGDSSVSVTSPSSVAILGLVLLFIQIRKRRSV